MTSSASHHFHTYMYAYTTILKKSSFSLIMQHNFILKLQGALFKIKSKFMPFFFYIVLAKITNQQQSVMKTLLQYFSKVLCEFLICLKIDLRETSHWSNGKFKYIFSTIDSANKLYITFFSLNLNFMSI